VLARSVAPSGTDPDKRSSTGCGEDVTAPAPIRGTHSNVDPSGSGIPVRVVVKPHLGTRPGLLEGARGHASSTTG